MTKGGGGGDKSGELTGDKGDKATERRGCKSGHKGKEKEAARKQTQASLPKQLAASTWVNPLQLSTKKPDS